MSSEIDKNGTFLKGQNGSMAKEITLNLFEFTSKCKEKNVPTEED